jgi:hypothetical protein
LDFPPHDRQARCLTTKHTKACLSVFDARPHPGLLPQEKEKRPTIFNAIHLDRHTRDTLTNNRISHLDPLSPGDLGDLGDRPRNSLKAKVRNGPNERGRVSHWTG